MPQVSSSHVDAVDYDEASAAMRVTFKNGSIYEYAGISKDVYDAVVNAESVGSALNTLVKGRYAYVRVY